MVSLHNSALNGVYYGLKMSLMIKSHLFFIALAQKWQMGDSDRCTFVIIFYYFVPLCDMFQYLFFCNASCVHFKIRLDIVFVIRLLQEC